jgi:hypothetical protein
LKHAPSPKPRQKPKILLPHRYIISVNALRGATNITHMRFLAIAGILPRKFTMSLYGAGYYSGDGIYKYAAPTALNECAMTHVI